MEHSCLSQLSNNNKNHYRNYNLLDINEKIKILHKINSNNSHKYSFDKRCNRNNKNKNKNINLLSSTLPSSILNKNHIYQKKLVKNNSTKNSPNILVHRISKSETKEYNNKEKIINEIKSDKILKQFIKDELKNEIIGEFLEDIANIDEQKVMNFLKIKNILMSSEKIQNYKIISKDKSNPDNITSEINTNSNDIFKTDKKKEKHKLIFNLDEIEKKKDLFNKKPINEVSPVKTIFNNLFINNNEKYIIKNPFQERDNNKQLNNTKRRKLFIQGNGEIQFSNFNFQIINNQKNYIKNNDSFYDFTSKSYISLFDDNIEKENINNNKVVKEEIIKQKQKQTGEIFELEKKNINNNNNIHCFKPINNKLNQNNNRYVQNSNIIKYNNEINYKSKKDTNLILKNIIKEINENKKEKNHKRIDKSFNNNIKKLNIKKKNVKIEDEKRKKLIKKIIENSKKAVKNKNHLNNNKYFSNLFFLRRNDKNKLGSNGELLNKSVIFSNYKNIKLNQINQQTFNTYSEHKERNKTFSNFLNDKNSNIFRICHIKKYLKVLKKDNNKHLLNTKWLKNISKKNGPLLCFDKNKV